MSSWSAGKRLSITTAFVVGLAVILGISAAWVTNHLGTQLDSAVNQVARQQMLAGHLSSRLGEIESLERQMGGAMQRQQKVKLTELEQSVSSAEQELLKAVSQLKPLSAGPALQDLQAIASELEAFTELHSQFANAHRLGKRDLAASTLNGKILPLLDQAGQRGRRLLYSQAAQLDTAQQEAQSIASLSLLGISVLGVLSVFVGIATVLSVRKIQTILRHSVTELNENARRLANTAGRVSASSQSVSHAASQQAASLEETSASTEQIHSMTKQNADNAESATRKTNEASATIHEANQALAQMVDSMNEITTSSNKISKIIKVIDDIAFQTNILALNAAVEAARAGEAGMGFAVVADEVRNLAQRSAQAARDTTQLIEESITRAAEGKEKLDEVARAITVLTNSSLEAKGLVEEVFSGSQEQARGIAQISRAVLQMEQLTQQLAATAQESAAAGQGLATQARGVDEIVVDLQKIFGVNDAARASEIKTFRPGTAKPAPGPSSTPATAPKPTHTPSLKALSKATESAHTPAPAFNPAPMSSPTRSGFTDQFDKPASFQSVGANRDVNPESVLPLDDDDFKPF
ncbi:MAG: methyl-accepting chemotaxis protein [Acidobacteria bacterium]|nr:methyl-accepting chemotaxis protein [Acidobacteriota bacterium]